MLEQYLNDESCTENCNLLNSLGLAHCHPDPYVDFV